MPSASLSRQPESPASWFDGGRGQALLEAEQGLLMPRLVRCPGDRGCLVLPTAAAAAHAMATLMRLETRLWCDAQGWHGAAQQGTHDAPPLPARSVDLVLAAHVLGREPAATARLRGIEHMLAPGGTAFLVELNPLSPWRWHWFGTGLKAPTLRRCAALAREAGLDVDAIYALNPACPGGAPGFMARRGWRPVSWLPLPAYVVRARKRPPGLTAVGPILPNRFSLEYPSA